MRILLIAGASAVMFAGVAWAQAANAQHPLFQADANQDGVVSRQEFDAGHDARFTQADANSDGQLSREEMRALHQRHRRGGGRHDRLGQADANNDGAISREEFLAQASAHFDRMDANNDGVVSAEERPQRGGRGGPGGHGERDGHGGMRHGGGDSNGDGLISRAEFAAMGAAHFGRLDVNNDGSVTQEEARQARRHH